MNDVEIRLMGFVQEIAVCCKSKVVNKEMLVPTTERHKMNAKSQSSFSRSLPSPFSSPRSIDNL